MFFALNECNVLQGFYFLIRSIKFVKLNLNLYLCNVRIRQQDLMSTRQYVSNYDNMAEN